MKLNESRSLNEQATTAINDYLTSFHKTYPGDTDRLADLVADFVYKEPGDIVANRYSWLTKKFLLAIAMDSNISIALEAKMGETYKEFLEMLDQLANFCDRLEDDQFYAELELSLTNKPRIDSAV